MMWTQVPIWLRYQLSTVINLEQSTLPVKSRSNFWSEISPIRRESFRSVCLQSFTICLQIICKILVHQQNGTFFNLKLYYAWICSKNWYARDNLCKNSEPLKAIRFERSPFCKVKFQIKSPNFVFTGKVECPRLITTKSRYHNLDPYYLRIFSVWYIADLWPKLVLESFFSVFACKKAKWLSDGWYTIKINDLEHKWKWYLNVPLE